MIVRIHRGLTLLVWRGREIRVVWRDRGALDGRLRRRKGTRWRTRRRIGMSHEGRGKVVRVRGVLPRVLNRVARRQRRGGVGRRILDQLLAGTAAQPTRSFRRRRSSSQARSPRWKCRTAVVPRVRVREGRAHARLRTSRTLEVPHPGWGRRSARRVGWRNVRGAMSLVIGRRSLGIGPCRCLPFDVRTSIVRPVRASV